VHIDNSYISPLTSEGAALKKIFANNHFRSSRIGWFGLMCGLALLVSACGSSSASLPSPTPSTVMGVLSTAPQPAEALAPVPTDTPTQAPVVIPTESATQPVAVLDVCSLITSTEAEAVLGQPVASIKPGTDTDSISGETINFCTYLGNGLAVVISTVDTGSENAAKDMLKKQLAQMLADDASTTSKEEAGLGDQAYWSVTENAASYTVVKDSHVFIVGLGGNIGVPASHKAPLLTLAKSVESKY
jgi:hypothetical protein